MTSTSEKKRRAFFYAESEAGAYNDTIELVVPLYRQAHETVLHLANQCFKRFGETAVNTPLYVLDVGSGTGTEAMNLYEQNPNVRIVALDLCEPMHREFERLFQARFGTKALFAEIVTPITGDIIGREGTPKSLLATLPALQRRRGFDLVISSFVIHHLCHLDKILAYRRIFDVLAPGGVFINADLFSFQSKTIASKALSIDLDWIRRSFEERVRKEGIIGAEWNKLHQLKNRWLRHYRNDNIAEPIEDCIIGKKKHTGQFTILRRIGFKEVACPFRYWQVGVLWASKSG